MGVESCSGDPLSTSESAQSYSVRRGNPTKYIILADFRTSLNKFEKSRRRTSILIALVTSTAPSGPLGTPQGAVESTKQYNSDICGQVLSLNDFEGAHELGALHTVRRGESSKILRF